MADERPRREDGVATVWSVAWIFACCTLGWVAFVAAMVVAAQHHVDGSADLVSLSAATRLQSGGDACAAAAAIAAENSVDLRSCRVVEQDVVVSVRSTLQLPFGLDGRLDAKARAGPV